MWQYNELYHHGIIGQKWGIRRFQNPDGTLTEVGRERYGTYEKKHVSYNDYSREKLKTANELNNKNPKKIEADRIYNDEYETLFEKIQSMEFSYADALKRQGIEPSADLFKKMFGGFYKNLDDLYYKQSALRTEANDESWDEALNVMLQKYGKTRVDALEKKWTKKSPYSLSSKYSPAKRKRKKEIEFQKIKGESNIKR